MNLFRPRQFLTPLACGLLATLAGCDKTTTAGGSDEIDTRMAVDRSGHPIAGARIALVKSGDSTGKVVAVNATADDGSYPEFRVPDGYYSVLVRDDADSLGKFVDSLKIESHTVPNGRDTLLTLGNVCGVVRVAQGHSPVTVTVGLLGTDIVANVKPDGTFKIELVPGSLYTLAAIPSLEGYGPLYKRIQLKDGQNLLLPDTLVMPVTGLPVPGGLSVAEDSLTGNVHLRWNRVDHPDLLGYVLDRVEGGMVTSSRYLTDTSWIDSLSGYWEELPMFGPWPSREVAYRVRSRSLSGLPDSRNVAATFTAMAPRWTQSVGDPQPRLVQDSITGDVRVTWPEVRHPLLKGYLVERIAGGVVISSSSLHDTLYVDSLGRHWDVLPLSGPWPDLQVGYRIGAIAKDTARGTVALLQGQAPTWIKLVDTIRIQVSQDTSTGNVLIRWNPVKHPHLVGYVVERIEDGVVQSGPTVVDTNFVDSLGAYWTALPLLGPWPERKVAYRVRLVADEVGTDGGSDTVGFDAHPPEWTKRVDSVKVVLTTDTVTGVNTLKWNTPVHPDLFGWSVQRKVNGSIDCSESLQLGDWSDVACEHMYGAPIDYLMRGTSVVRLLVPEKVTFGYDLVALRRIIPDETIASVSHFQDVQNFVRWRDSLVPDVDANIVFQAFGGWVLKQRQSNLIISDSWISTDGVSWEIIPHQFNKAIGVGDSLWTFQLDADSLHFRFCSRVRSGIWSTKTMALPGKVRELKALSVLDGKVVIAYSPSSDLGVFQDTVVEIIGDSLFRSSQIGGVGPIISMANVRSVPVTEKLRIDELQQAQGSIVSTVVSGKVIASKNLYSEKNIYMTLLGPIGDSGDIVARYSEGARSIPQAVFVPVVGDAIMISYPQWVTSEVNTIIFQGEIWCKQDGHIWKGKLNLPE